MANPSLQIGNEKWAIKEDNLLGYSTAGTRFVPQPITMTRASAGTRVNSSGLVETVELLGSDLTSPLNFLSTWLEASVDSKTYNTFTVGGSGRGMYFMLPENKTLKINVSGVTGSVELRYRTTTGGAGTVLGDFDTDLYLTTTNATTNIYLRATVGGTVSVTDISVKESTKNNLARVDYDGTASSLLAEPQRTNLYVNSEPTVNEGFEQNTSYESFSWANGFTNCVKFGDNSVLRARYGATIPASTEVTLSCFIIMDDLSEPVGSISSLSGDFSFVIAGSATGSGTINTNINMGNNIWKISKTDTSGTSNLGNNGIVKYTTQSSKGFRVVGWQIEVGSYATSYIPNFGEAAGVTRVQDQYEKSGISDKIGQTEGTLFIELSKPTTIMPSLGLISLNNAASNSDANSIAIGFFGSDDFYFRVQSNNVPVFSSSNIVTSANTFYKVAISYKSVGGSLIYVDGSPVTPNQGSLAGTFTFGVTLDNLSFDYNGNNVLPFYGKVKQLQIFKTALSPSELATLTT